MPKINFTGKVWEPKYDFAVPEARFGRNLKADRGQVGIVGETWVQAPDTSHCEAFLFIDNRAWPHDTLEHSLLLVRFKATDTQPVKEYFYEFTDAEQGADIFRALVRAQEPWKEVGYPRLVQGKVPYGRRS